MLEIRELRSRYGRIEVLHGIGLNVQSGEIVTVVGANGAGKTTLLRCISGTQPVSGGEITFRGETITAVPAWSTACRAVGCPLTRPWFVTRVSPVSDTGVSSRR